MSHAERRRIDFSEGDTNCQRIDIIELERWLQQPASHPIRTKDELGDDAPTPRRAKALQHAGHAARRQRLAAPRSKVERDSALVAKAAAAYHAAAQAEARELERRLASMPRWEVPSAMSPPPLRFGPSLPVITSSPRQILGGRLRQPPAGLVLTQLDTIQPASARERPSNCRKPHNPPSWQSSVSCSPSPRPRSLLVASASPPPLRGLWDHPLHPCASEENGRSGAAYPSDSRPTPGEAYLPPGYRRRLRGLRGVSLADAE